MSTFKKINFYFYITIINSNNMNKTIMITGATAGFGRATAVKFAENGNNIIITGRRKELLDDLEKELKTFGKIKVLSLNFDVRKKSEVESVIANLSEEWKAIDILVNNLKILFNHWS